MPLLLLLNGTGYETSVVGTPLVGTDRAAGTEAATRRGSTEYFNKRDFFNL